MENMSELSIGREKAKDLKHNRKWIKGPVSRGTRNYGISISGKNRKAKLAQKHRNKGTHHVSEPNMEKQVNYNPNGKTDNRSLKRKVSNG